MLKLPTMTLLAAGMLAGAPAGAAGPPTVAARPYLVPSFHAGAQFANVFSRTIAVQARGFDDHVRRVSGSAVYHVKEATSARPRLTIDYRYDGLQQGSGEVAFDKGGAISCFNGECRPNTDASGLVYNPLLWGTPPERLWIGQHWTVTIESPWELGTAGRETVTVVALDPVRHSVTLKREGEGEGFFLGEKKTLALVRDGVSRAAPVQPGHAHWYGYTTFRAGIVDSDELMVERPLVLGAEGTDRIEATEREYILLNAMPSS